MDYFIGHLGHVSYGVCVVHQLSLVHFNFSQPKTKSFSKASFTRQDLRIDGQEELPLVGPDPGVRDPLHQLGVLVYQPSLPQHVGCCILQLKAITLF